VLASRAGPQTEADAVFALIDKLNGHFEKAIEIMYNAKAGWLSPAGQVGPDSKKIAQRWPRPVLLLSSCTGRSEHGVWEW